MGKTEKMVIANYSFKPLLVMLEPWGEDYTLKPKEQFEIIAEDCETDFYYSVSYENDYVAVYAEGGSGREYPRVYSHGSEVDCGHNRELTDKIK